MHGQIGRKIINFTADYHPAIIGGIMRGHNLSGQDILLTGRDVRAALHGAVRNNINAELPVNRQFLIYIIVIFYVIYGKITCRKDRAKNPFPFCSG